MRMKKLPKLLFLLAFRISCSYAGILPDGLEGLVIYYNDFEQENGKANLNPLDIQENINPKSISDGLFGRGFLSEGIPMFGGGGISLHSPHLSPLKSLTISVWWALKEDHKPGQGFVIFSFNGKGFISNFVRGGDGDTWCGLSKPAAVFQVYYFSGIQNINGIYDFDIMKTLNLKGGIWHNLIATFSCGREIKLYQDGKIVGKWVLTRSFRKEDEINTLSFASGEEMYIDEILILKGVMNEEEVLRYYNAIKGLKEMML
ncbi:hypothetical protein H5T87_06140 [bacterium]|nr:hypothetical protein [bacterium]